MPLVFGSKEANDILERDTGFRFDVHWPDPFQVVERDVDDHDDSDRYCTVCGGYMEFIDCWQCGGAGEFDAYEDDPLWFEPGDTEDCDVCRGVGGYWECASLPHEESEADHA